MQSPEQPVCLLALNQDPPELTAIIEDDVLHLLISGLLHSSLPIQILLWDWGLPWISNSYFQPLTLSEVKKTNKLTIE